MKREKSFAIFLMFTIMIGTIGMNASTVYGELTAQVWTYNDPSYTVKTTTFGDGDTVYVEVTDTITTGSPKTISVKNNTIGNKIFVEVNEDTKTMYRGSFIVYSGANDDENDKLALFTGQTATINAYDGKGTETINCVLGAYINLSDPSPVKAGDIAVTLTTSKNVVKVPTPLTLTLSDSTTLEITLTGNIPGDTFRGSFTVDDSVPEGRAIFSLVGSALEDQEGNTSDIILSGDSIVIDQTPPPPPTNLSVTLSGGVKISWNASFPEDDVGQYKVYRSSSSGVKNTDVLVVTISANGSPSYSWIDTGVNSGNFYYIVISEDLAGNQSEPSNESFVEHKEFLSLSFVQSVARRDSPAKIILKVNQPADITIYIFNLIGEVVYKWNNYVTSETEWLWTGVNMYGERVNNGTYICKITVKAGDGSTVNRTKILGVLY